MRLSPGGCRPVSSEGFVKSFSAAETASLIDMYTRFYGRVVYSYVHELVLSPFRKFPS